MKQPRKGLHFPPYFSVVLFSPGWKTDKTGGQLKLKLELKYANTPNGSTRVNEKIKLSALTVT